ncbi:MAG: DUF4097 domain-containing protein [Steroidobacteraceae bacterium]|nr:DUF4097 domain-containing protein [Steroidobacteraceae bacterium]
MTTSTILRSARSSWPLAAAMLLAASPASLAGTPINESAAADPSGSVEVSNISGTVSVTGWDGNQVEVTGTLGDGTERLDFITQDKVTRIKVILPKNAHNVDDTDLVIRVPAGSSLSVNTISADITAQGVAGAQRLQSVSGDIRTVAGSEDVECKSVSGDVAIDGSGKKGLIGITTVSGDVKALKVAGEVNASTVSGDVLLGLGVTERSRVRSTSGDLVMAMRLAGDGKFDAETISGDVRLNLFGDVEAEYDISTFSGDIRNCFGPKPVSTSEYTPGKELRFSEGKASSRVRIKSLNGDIKLCRK